MSGLFYYYILIVFECLLKNLLAVFEYVNLFFEVSYWFLLFISEMLLFNTEVLWEIYLDDYILMHLKKLLKE